MGGRAAEEIFLDQRTTGAGNDIERVTEMARKMVCEWGMSEKLGPLTFGKRDEQIFLGREISQHRDFSEATAQEIDVEVRRIAEAGYSKAMEILKSNSKALVRIAEALLEREVLDSHQIDLLIAGDELPPMASISDPASEASAAKGVDDDAADTSSADTGVLPTPGNQPA
jgi:cell division protease FtsH